MSSNNIDNNTVKRLYKVTVAHNDISKTISSAHEMEKLEATESRIKGSSRSTGNK